VRAQFQEKLQEYESLLEKEEAQIQHKTSEYSINLKQTEEQAETEAKLRLDAEQKLKVVGEQISELEQQLNAETETRQTAQSQLISEKKLISQLQEKLSSYQQQLSEVNDIQTILGKVEERLQAEIQARLTAEKEIEAERKSRNRLEQEVKSYSEQLADVKEKLIAKTARESIVDTAAGEQAEAQLTESGNPATPTGICECCGKDDIKEGELVKINSGQLLCRQCYLAFKNSGVS